jgi:hypothetical protein
VPFASRTLAKHLKEMEQEEKLASLYLQMVCQALDDLGEDMPSDDAQFISSVENHIVRPNFADLLAPMGAAAERVGLAIRDKLKIGLCAALAKLRKIRTTECEQVN